MNLSNWLSNFFSKKKLKELDPEAEVIVTSSNFEHSYRKVPVTFVHQYNEGSKKQEQFRDAFDNENYKKEIWSVIGGDLKIVLIS